MVSCLLLSLCFVILVFFSHLLLSFSVFLVPSVHFSTVQLQLAPPTLTCSQIEFSTALPRQPRTLHCVFLYLQISFALCCLIPLIWSLPYVLAFTSRDCRLSFATSAFRCFFVCFFVFVVFCLFIFKHLESVWNLGSNIWLMVKEALTLVPTNCLSHKRHPVLPIWICS